MAGSDGSGEKKLGQMMEFCTCLVKMMDSIPHPKVSALAFKHNYSDQLHPGTNPKQIAQTVEESFKNNAFFH
ncbi:hypothetical protein HDU82_000973, partial [Entophlyctis luteolus]